MADEQAGTRPPEPASYDADMIADVTGAYREVETRDTEAPAPEPASTPSTPAEPRADHPTEKNRYADGTFKPTREDVAQNAANEQHAKAVREQPGAQQQQPEQQQQPAAPQTNMPPGRWSPLAKSAWDAEVPTKEQWAAIKESAVRGEKEVNEGFAQYEGMRELRPFADLARSQNQSPREVIERYMGAEQHLRQDFIGGMLAIGQGMGYSPQQIAHALSPYLGHSNGQDWASTGTQMPEPGTQMPDQAYLQQWLNPLAQKVQHLERLVQQQYEAEQRIKAGTINGVLEKFASDPAHRYFPNVQDKVIELFQTGMVKPSGDYTTDLKRAYRMACADNDEIADLLFKERLASDQAAKAQQQKEAAERARRASRSITGSPSNGSPMDFGDDDGSVEADTKRAYRSLVGL